MAVDCLAWQAQGRRGSTPRIHIYARQLNMRIITPNTYHHAPALGQGGTGDISAHAAFGRKSGRPLFMYARGLMVAMVMYTHRENSPLFMYARGIMVSDALDRCAAGYLRWCARRYRNSHCRACAMEKAHRGECEAHVRRCISQAFRQMLVNMAMHMRQLMCNSMGTSLRM